MAQDLDLYKATVVSGVMGIVTMLLCYPTYNLSVQRRDTSISINTIKTPDEDGELSDSDGEDDAHNAQSPNNNTTTKPDSFMSHIIPSAKFLFIGQCCAIASYFIGYALACSENRLPIFSYSFNIPAVGTIIPSYFVAPIVFLVSNKYLSRYLDYDSSIQPCSAIFCSSMLATGLTGYSNARQY